MKSTADEPMFNFDTTSTKNKSSPQFDNDPSDVVDTMVTFALSDVSKKLAERGESSYVLGSCLESGLTSILFCSKNFCKTTKYATDELLGESANCSFLFGPDTRPEHIRRVLYAVDSRNPVKITLVLYRKTGDPFIGTLNIQFIRTDGDEVALALVTLREIIDLKDTSYSFLLPSRKRLLFSRLAKSKLAKQAKRATSRLKIKKNTPKYLQLDANDLNAMDTDIAPDNTRLTIEHVSKPVNTNRFMASHDALWKIMWDWLILVCTFYVGVVTPYDAVFILNNPYMDALSALIVDGVIDVIFIIDLVLNFRTSYQDKLGKTVSDPKLIARHYLSTWFLVDFVAAIPFDVLYPVILPAVHKVVTLLKCLRLLRIARLFDKISLYSQYSSVVLLINITIYVLIAHWFACIWYYIGIVQYNTSSQQSAWSVGWINKFARQYHQKYQENRPELPSPLLLYMTAMYFTVTLMTSVGFGNEAANTVDEKIFSTIAMIIGAIMHAVVFANVTAIIQRMYSRRASYDVQSNELKEFFRIYRIPRQLKRKIQDFVQTRWVQSRGINHEKLFEDFPEDLNADIRFCMYSSFLTLSIFDGAPVGCLKSMALEIKHTFINAKEHLIHRGDMLKNFYFIASGSMEVIQKESVVSAYGSGDLLGTDIFLPQAKCNSDVRALTYCDMHCMPIKALLSILTLYPEFAISFSEKLDQYLSFNLRDEGEPVTVRIIDDALNESSDMAHDSVRKTSSPASLFLVEPGSPTVKLASEHFKMQDRNSITMERVNQQMKLLTDEIYLLRQELIQK